MSTVRTAHIKSNHNERPLKSLSEIDPTIAEEWFNYVTEDEDNRFVQYRGSWYDTYEFEVAPDHLKARGWDAWQPESAFSAVLLQWFDKDGYEREGVVVGYAHW